MPSADALGFNYKRLQIYYCETGVVKCFVVYF